MPRETFISHRHADKKIADIIRIHLQLLGIPKEKIFQSSYAKGGLVIGRPIKEELWRVLILS